MDRAKSHDRVWRPPKRSLHRNRSVTVPRPPDFGAFNELKFITNYALLGCAPPYDLLVEFSQEPLLELFLLFAGLDPQDIVQGMLDPRHKRRRSPARHGRKRPKLPGLPDINDEIGGIFNGEPGGFRPEDMPGGRKIFRAINLVERVTYTAAVLEGVTDVGYSVYWGTVNLNPEFCLEIDRIVRNDYNRKVAGGAGPYFNPFGIDHLVTNRGFFDSGFGTTHSGSDWEINVAVNLQFYGDDGYSAGSIGLQSDRYGIVAESFGYNLGPGEAAHRSVSYRAESGEFVSWGIVGADGFIDINHSDMLAYSATLPF